MENVELRPMPDKGSHRSFSHDGRDPWATDDVSDIARYADDGDDENLLRGESPGNSKPGLTPTTPDARGHARDTSKHAFLPGDNESLQSKDFDAAPWYARLRGWRFGAANCTTAVTIVLLINLFVISPTSAPVTDDSSRSLTLWVATAKGYQDGRGIIFEGMPGTNTLHATPCRLTRRQQAIAVRLEE